MTDPVDSGLRRVLWRCRRGTRELDLILSGFAEAEYTRLGPGAREDFEALLGVQDPVLNDWLWNELPADEDYRDIVALVLAHKGAM